MVRQDTTPLAVASGHHGQSKIIPTAAFVAGLESVAAGDDGRAVGQITKGAGDHCCRGIVNDGKDCPRREHASAKVSQTDLGAANPYSPSVDFIGSDQVAIKSYFVSRVPQHRQLVGDLQSAGRYAILPRPKDRAR